MDEKLAMATSDATGSSSSGDDSASESELMVTTRTRRITAGNRYNTLLAQEEAAEEAADDDVALLFAEGDEIDEEYHSDAEADEADMSSSDDDDAGPNAAADDLEGEKEIQKEDKAERTKKRKADLAMTSMSGLKKKTKIDPTALHRIAEKKPSKRKERVSWLPEQNAAPGRTSLRKQTIAHRADTLAKLKVNEQQRLKMKAIRERKEKEREADAPKELTQEDRLAEAARVERRNAKSLNRWEAMEKKRAEEQAARLAALKNRKLEGAVITWHSSAYKYIGLKDDKDPDGDVPVEVKKRGRKPKAFHEQNTATATEVNAAPNENVPKPAVPTEQPEAVEPSNSAIQKLEVSSPMKPPATQSSVDKPENPLNTNTHETNDINLNNVATPEPPPEPQKDVSLPMTNETISVAPAELKSEAAQQIELEQSADTNPTLDKATTQEIDAINATSSAQDSMMVDVVHDQQPLITEIPDESNNTTAMSKIVAGVANVTERTQNQQKDASQPPPVEVVSTRNLVVLDKFEGLSSRDRSEYGFFYNNRKTAKPIKHVPTMCPVTGLAARYRDKATGIGYANALAYKRLQDLRTYQFTWSTMLGCYTGRTTLVARGVPEGFLE